MKRSAVFHGIRLTAFTFSRAFLGLVLGLAVWSVLPIAIQWQPTVVMSGSMEPTILTGDVVIADPITQDEIAQGIIGEGHVLLAHDPSNPGTLYTHRVVRVLDNGKFMTKGDANATADSAYLSSSDVIGIERLRVPYIGIPVQQMKKGNFFPAGVLIFLIVACTILAKADNDRYKPRKEQETAENRKSIPDVPSKALTALLLVVIASGTAITLPRVADGSEAFFSGNTYSSGDTFQAADVFPVRAGNGMTTIGTYSKKHSYTSDFTGAFPMANIKSSIAAGYSPLVEWIPGSFSNPSLDKEYRTNKILNGTQDAYLTSIANQIVAAGNPRFSIALAPGAIRSTNLWYEKGITNANGNYVSAWQYVVSFMKAKGVKNVDWVWTIDAPVASTENIAGLYPGAAYVNLAGVNVTMFNTSGVPTGTLPEQIVGTALSKVSDAAPGKSILMSQTDTMPSPLNPSQLKWVDNMKSYFTSWNANQPNKITGLVGFTYP